MVLEVETVEEEDRIEPFPVHSTGKTIEEIHAPHTEAMLEELNQSRESVETEMHQDVFEVIESRTASNSTNDGKKDQHGPTAASSGPLVCPALGNLPGQSTRP